MKIADLNEAIMYDVESNNIKSIGWEDNKLEVEFNSGSIYEYDDVPEDIYDEFINAPSKGKYFHRHIKYGYNYRRIN